MLTDGNKYPWNPSRLTELGGLGNPAACDQKGRTNGDRIFLEVCRSLRSVRRLVEAEHDGPAFHLGATRICAQTLQN